MEGTTNYLRKKQCLNCLYINEWGLSRCTQCNYLFIQETNQEEADKVMQQISERLIENERD